MKRRFAAVDRGGGEPVGGGRGNSFWSASRGGNPLCGWGKRAATHAASNIMSSEDRLQRLAAIKRLAGGNKPPRSPGG